MEGVSNQTELLAPQSQSSPTNDRLRSQMVRRNKHIRAQYKPKADYIHLSHNHQLPQIFEIDLRILFSMNRFAFETFLRESYWLFRNRKTRISVKIGRIHHQKYTKYIPTSSLQRCNELNLDYLLFATGLFLHEIFNIEIDYISLWRLIKKPKFLQIASLCERLRNQHPHIFRKALLYLPLSTQKFCFGWHPNLITSFDQSATSRTISPDAYKDLQFVLYYAGLRNEKEIMIGKPQKFLNIKHLRLQMPSDDTAISHILTPMLMLTSLQTLIMIFDNLRGPTIYFKSLITICLSLKSLKKIKWYFLETSPDLDSFFEIVKNLKVPLEIKLAVHITEANFLKLLPRPSSQGIRLKHVIRRLQNVRGEHITITLKMEGDEYVLTEIRGDFFTNLHSFLLLARGFYPVTRELIVKWQQSFYLETELTQFTEELINCASKFEKLVSVDLRLGARRLTRPKPLAFLKCFGQLKGVKDFQIEINRESFVDDLPTKELIELINSFGGLKSFSLKMPNLREPMGSKAIIRCLIGLSKVDQFIFEGSIERGVGKNILQGLEKRRGVHPHVSKMEVCAGNVERTTISFSKNNQVAKNYENYYNWNRGRSPIYAE